MYQQIQFRRPGIRGPLSIALGLLASASCATAQTTSFHHQGVLKDGAIPVNGPVDFQFRLFDSETLGTQIGVLAVRDDVTVTNGQFQLLLDFGATPWSGSPRWLETAVRPGNETGAFSTLSPRQLVAPVPYAIHALQPSGGLTLPFSGSVASDATAFSITNTGSGRAGLFKTEKADSTAPALEAVTDSSVAIKAVAPGTGVAVLGLGTVIGSAGSGASGTAGIRGEATNATGQTYGVHGSTESNAANASGVFGVASATTGATNGVWGQTDSGTTGANGLFGVATAATGVTHGVYGSSASNAAGASGVRGETRSASGAVYGVHGVTTSSGFDASGVFGQALAPVGSTHGVSGVSRSQTGIGVLGYADPVDATGGIAFGVEGITSSVTHNAAGVRGIAIGGAGRIYGVSGLTDSPTVDAAGVYGEGHSSGQGYGVHGVSTSPADGATGVKGQALVGAGRVYGVHGTSASSAGGTAGVRGEVASAAPAGAAVLATMGVWGYTPVQNRTVGVQGDAYFLGTPAFSLDARIGVRGYAGPYGAETTRRVGVEGDAHNEVPEPFISSGVRGFNRGSISAEGTSGVVGQVQPIGGTGPEPSVSGLGHNGVWGVTQSGILNSAGVLGDATLTSASTTFGVWGRSKSGSALAAGVRAEGNGAEEAGRPRAAALEIRNGAITVSGGLRPAGTLPVEGDWIALRAFCEAEGQHTIGQMASVTLNNELIRENSIILATVETLAEVYYNRAYYVQVHGKSAGTCQLRVTVLGACDPPGDTIVVHYQIINPAPDGG